MFSCTESGKGSRGEKFEGSGGDKIATEKRRRCSESQQSQLKYSIDNIWDLDSPEVSIRAIFPRQAMVRQYQLEQTEPTAGCYPGSLAKQPETSHCRDDENAGGQNREYCRLKEDCEIKISSTALDRRTDGGVGVASPRQLHVARLTCVREQLERNALSTKPSNKCASEAIN